MYEKTEAGLVASPALLVNRVKAHYPSLFPFSLGKYNSLAQLSEVMGPRRGTRLMLVYCNTDISRAAFLASVLNRKTFCTNVLLNAHKLLDIYIGKIFEDDAESEEHRSILSFDEDLIMLTLGFNEFENRRQGDALSQLLEHVDYHQRSFWLFYKGYKVEFMSRYGALHKQMSSKAGILEIDLNEGKDNKPEPPPPPVTPHNETQPTNGVNMAKPAADTPEGSVGATVVESETPNITAQPNMKSAVYEQ